MASAASDSCAWRPATMVSVTPKAMTASWPTSTVPAWRAIKERSDRPDSVLWDMAAVELPHIAAFARSVHTMLQGPTRQIRQGHGFARVGTAGIRRMYQPIAAGGIVQRHQSQLSMELQCGHLGAVQPIHVHIWEL